MTDPEQWAANQQELHNKQIKLYEDRFDNNKIMYFHDLWEYVERKLAHPTGAVVMVHPLDDNQHPSVPNQLSSQPHLYVK